MQAKGTFQVKIIPVEVTELEKEAGIGRMTIDKTWQGDLAGLSKGTMLNSIIESTGAMAYVALEKLDIYLAGKSGSFYFSHAASMTKGDKASAILQINVVPGSGTGELTGIEGKLDIQIDDAGAHTYVFDYQLTK